MPTGIRIEDIAYYLPEQVVTNGQLRAEHPDWDMANVEARAGVVERHVARKDETALDLAVRACEDLFARNPEAHQRLDALLFCTQCPDYILPPNSCVLHKALGLPDEVFALDYNWACSGYPYGLALAQGLVLSRIAKSILLVTADTYSKYIHQGDRSARVLFGDGAAVTWITASEAGRGLMDIECCTSGKSFDKFIIPAGGCRAPKTAETGIPRADESGNQRTLENIQMDGMGILQFVNSRVPQQVRKVMARNSVTNDGIDLFVFHQASRMVLDSLARLLRIPPDKMYANLARIGNTVSASIPIALKDAWVAGRVSRGSQVLLAGFGVGLSWCTALLEL